MKEGLNEWTYKDGRNPFERLFTGAFWMDF
jgi:hypothetical protein